MLWVLIGWQFTVARVRRRDRDDRADDGAAAPVRQPPGSRSRHASTHRRPTAAISITRPGEQLSWRQRLTSVRAWSDVAHNFRGDWQMLYKEIAIGFLLAGFIAQFGNGFFEHLFLRHAPAPLPTIENVIVGPIIAVLSFVCSVGNVPLAAVLWSGGISFAGRARVPVRRPDRAADPADLPQVLRHHASPCGSRR